MTAKRFTHKINRLGMQFICYDEKSELLGTFADADGVAHIVEILNELHEENQQIKSTIKEAYQNERTKIGQSVLKQLMETIQ